MNKANKPTTATVKIMFVVERSRETIIFTLAKDSIMQTYRLDETHIITTNL